MRPIFACLADPTHLLPLPGRPGSFFPAEGADVDADDAFIAALLADGSLVAPSSAIDAAPIATAPTSTDVED